MKDHLHKESPTETLRCLLWGALTGGCVGVVVFLFKLIAEHLEELSHHIYTAAAKNPLYAALVLAGLILLAVMMHLLHKWAPEIKGGGIPRATGIMRGVLTFSRLRTFIGTLIGSWISFFAGLPLGSEGPSVLVGTALGSGLGSLNKKCSWARYVSTAGAGAGFAVATGAPLTAILFIIEEVHRRLTVRLILIVSAASLSASLVNQALCSAFGISPTLFAVEPLREFALTELHYILLTALIVTLAVWLYDISVVSFKKLMQMAGRRIPAPAKLIFVFLAVGVVGLFMPDALYGGRGLILGIMNRERLLTLLILLFIWRFGMAILTSNSGATGGTFVPTLCIGALVGGLSGELMTALGMPQELYVTIVLIAMCAFLGGTMRAPLTASLFFVEASAQSNNLLFAAVAIFAVYFITNAIGRHSFNDVMLEEMIEGQKAKN